MDIEKNKDGDFTFSFEVYRDDWHGVYDYPFDTEFETIDRDDLIALRDKITRLLGE